MDERRLEMKVGGLVLTALVGVLGLLWLMGELSPGHDTVLFVDFAHMGNVVKGAPVKLGGLSVGRVEELQLLPERRDAQGRPVPVRIKDWREVYEEQELGQLQRQAEPHVTQPTVQVAGRGATGAGHHTHETRGHRVHQRDMEAQHQRRHEDDTPSHTQEGTHGSRENPRRDQEEKRHTQKENRGPLDERIAPFPLDARARSAVCPSPCEARRPWTAGR